VIGDWLLVIGYWLLVIGYRLLVIGYWLLVVCYWLFVIGYWLFVIGYWLFVICYWLFVICFMVYQCRFAAPNTPSLSDFRLPILDESDQSIQNPKSKIQNCPIPDAPFPILSSCSFDFFFRSNVPPKCQ
jgi:hypothetical protein